MILYIKMFVLVMPELTTITTVLSGWIGKAIIVCVVKSVVWLLLYINIKSHSWFRRGAIVTTFIVCYALTSFISGYVSGGMYSRNGGMHLTINCQIHFSAWLCLTFSIFPYFTLYLQYLVSFFGLFRQKLDKINDPYSISIPIYVLRDWLCLEHNCYILWISGCYSLWHNGGSFCDLGLHFFPSGSSWYSCWKKLEWCSKQSMSCEDYPSSNS